MLRRLLLIICLAMVVVPDAMLLPALAQDTQQPPPKKRQTLFDFLFGGGQQDQTPPPAPIVTKPKKGALPPPPKPTVEKSETATRVAIFGDAYATQLAAALTRFYAEDPNILIIDQGVGSSGFARPTFFDWDKTAADQVTKNTFDIAIMMIGLSDRQSIKVDGQTLKTLTPEWTEAYSGRVKDFVGAIHGANKPLIWVGLPPMSDPDLTEAMSEISSTQRLAVFGGGAEFIDIYDKFVDEDGNYTQTGPDLNGAVVKMRKGDGLLFTTAGADKLAFYVTQTLKLYYHGGGAVGLTVADALAGTDAVLMVRPPYQGLGQTRLLEIAGAVIPLTQTPKRASDLVIAAAPPVDPSFNLDQMLTAPKGRVDDFGLGQTVVTTEETPPVAAATPVAAQ